MLEEWELGNHVRNSDDDVLVVGKEFEGHRQKVDRSESRRQYGNDKQVKSNTRKISSQDKKIFK